ncbi:MAG: hypothetical protein EU542_05875 [Promethearchaeota archaeon]|nr:MAG: hypothetical protein EU542_05875 [Candidatus Lokiarchaeota archaeon]
MAFSDLTELEILQGTLGLIWVLIAIIIGIRIIHKALLLKRTSDLITVAFSYILVSSAWWGLSLQFIMYGFFNILLEEVFYLLISNIFIPFAMICWIYSYCKILDPKRKEYLLKGFIIFTSLWELFIFVGLFIDIRLVGTLNSKFDSSHGPLLLVFILIGIASFLITGTVFAFKSMKLEDPEVQWKGRFLLLAWICFAVGALLDAALPLTAITLILVRAVLILSAISFYFGFFLPKKLVIN